MISDKVWKVSCFAENKIEALPICYSYYDFHLVHMNIAISLKPFGYLHIWIHYLLSWESREEAFHYYEHSAIRSKDLYSHVSLLLASLDNYKCVFSKS
jgi:hypothetical protein